MKEKLALILSVLALATAIAVPLWTRYDLLNRLSPIQASVQVLEDTAKTNRALIEAQAAQAKTPLPTVVTGTDWQRAWDSVPACGAAEQPIPSAESLKILGLEGLMARGYVPARLCFDAASRHVAFILAKENLTSPGPDMAPTCVDSCDLTVFGVIHGDTKSLRYIESVNHLGIYAEAYNQYCLIDKVVDDGQNGPESLLFYCGSGEYGGLNAWYQHSLVGDKLTLVQKLLEFGPPQKLDVKETEILKLFSRQAN